MENSNGPVVELPWWQKYTLTLNEASEYFNRLMIKRELFERYMDERMSVI